MISQVDFIVESDPDWTNSLCTIDVSGANITITNDDGTVVTYVEDAETGTVRLTDGQNYTATVWQTDTDVDEWIVSMSCSSAAPTSEPSADPTGSPTSAAPTGAPTTPYPTVLPTMVCTA